MMVNRNNAGAFYGHRPWLASQLPSYHGHSSSVLTDYQNLRHPLLHGVGESAGKIYMPGAVGAKAVGSLMDKFASVAMGYVKTAFPALGTVLSYVGDALDFVLKPIGNLLEAMALGACTYLEEKQAQAVLDDMNNNKMDYVVEAAKDVLYAFYRRVSATQSQVTNIKEGRDPIIQGAIGLSLDTLKISRTSNRVASRVYNAAIKAGAKDWQAAAAVCYGVLEGFKTEGFPSGFEFKVKGVTIAKVGQGKDAQKPIYSLGSSFDGYFTKLGTPIERTVDWVNKKYKEKSGGAIGGTGGNGGKSTSGSASVLPLLAVAALALFSSRG